MHINAKTQHNTNPDYVRRIMHETGLTQQQIADRLDLSRVTVGNYYAGKKPLPYTAQVCIELLRGAGEIPAHDNRYAAVKCT